MDEDIKMTEPGTEPLMEPVEIEEQKAIGAKTDILLLDPKYFGPFWQYVENDDITDVDFNGTDLWITDTQNRRTKISGHGITADFIQAFSQRVANQVSKPFNKMNNLLEAETDTLRISILHESAAVSGRSVCLRKSLPTVRITPQSIVSDNYMPRAVMNLLVNCIKTRLNFVIGGEVAAGKTECAKFFTQFVPEDQRVITIEDSPEWHFHKINPEHDCVEMRVNPDFDYAKAIKTCLRQNPKWIMLSEARSVEVKYLIESWSTGVHGVTTIHTDDIRHIPSRLLNMMANRIDADRLENDIYEFVNVVMLIRKKDMFDGTRRRYVDQVGFLYRDGKENKVHMLVKNGELVSDWLPPDIAFHLEREGIEKPFECKEIDERLGSSFTYTYMKKEPETLPIKENEEPVKEPENEEATVHKEEPEEDKATFSHLKETFVPPVYEVPAVSKEPDKPKPKRPVSRQISLGNILNKRSGDK